MNRTITKAAGLAALAAAFKLADVPNMLHLNNSQTETSVATEQTPSSQSFAEIAEIVSLDFEAK